MTKWHNPPCIWWESVSLYKSQGNRPQMITSLTPFSSVVAGFPQFIEETNADWDMATDYILSQVSALTYSEWAIIEKIYDETTASMSN